MLDYLKVSDDVRRKIENACCDLNTKPIMVSRYSTNERDSYLYYVLAKRYLPNLDEDDCYVLWLYNDSFNTLCNGVYMLSFPELIKEYNKRLNK